MYYCYDSEYVQILLLKNGTSIDVKNKAGQKPQLAAGTQRYIQAQKAEEEKAKAEGLSKVLNTILLKQVEENKFKPVK